MSEQVNNFPNAQKDQENEINHRCIGIQVSPNSSRVLRKLGVDKYIEKYCTEPIDLRMMRWENGQVLVQCPLKGPAEKEYGSPYW